MITIYDRTHAFVGATYSYSGLCLEEKVDTGDKTLTFTYERFGSEIIYQYPRLLRYRQPQSISSHVFLDDYFSAQVVLEDFQIEPEYYVVYDGQEYVVKQVQGDKITCILNLEWLRCSFFKDFEFKYQLYGNVGHYEVRIRSVAPTSGPTIDFFRDFINESDDSAVIDGTTYYWWAKRMPVGLAEGDGLDLVYALCDAYMYEPVFDTLNKKVHFYERVGSDRGVEFRKGLNLKTVNKKVDSFDFYTVIYPIGKNGLEIDNPNHPTYYPTPTGDTSTLISDKVVCDFTYANKTRVYYWHDENYSDADLLKEDAEKLLADMCHPIVSYEVKVRDLADSSSNFSGFSFGLGDVVTIIDPDTNTYEKQRIIARKIYPQDRSQDTVTVANSMLTFQEIQSKLTAAQRVVNSVSHNGKILLSAIKDIAPISGTATAESGFSFTQNVLTRQLSQVSLSLRVTGSFSPSSPVVTVGTVPDGFRPKTNVAFVGVSSSTSDGSSSVAITITTDGSIRVNQYGTASTWAQFDVAYATGDDVPEPSDEDDEELRAIEDVLDLDATGMTRSQRVQRVNEVLDMEDVSGTESEQITRAYNTLAVNVAASTGSSVLDDYEARIQALETGQGELEDRLDAVETVYVTMTPYDIVEGSIYNCATQETYGEDSAYAHAFYRVEPGKTYFISGSSASGSTVYPACAFFQEGHVFRLARFGDDPSTTYTDLEVVAPADSDYMVLNRCQSGVVVKSSQTETLSDAIDDVRDTIDAVGDMSSQMTVLERKVDNGFAPASVDATILESLRNPFKFKPFDKGYVTFVFDDLRSQQDSIASIFEMYDMPLVLAAIPSRMGVVADGLTSSRGNFTPGMYMYEVVQQVVQNGGETMAHNSVVITMDNQYDYDVMYEYFVGTKEKLERWLSRTGPIRGIIRAGGANQISSSREIERWLYPNYEYSDLGNHSQMECYYLNRVNVNQPLATIKSLIDDCEQNKTWLRFYGHDYDYGGGQTLTGEQDLMDILDYVASKNVGVATCAYMYDTFRSTEAEENVRAMLNNS